MLGPNYRHGGNKLIKTWKGSVIAYQDCMKVVCYCLVCYCLSILKI